MILPPRTRLSAPRRSALFTAFLVLLLAALGAAAEPQFENIGIGGGGAMFEPACSPYDHHLMFVACDMGGVYRSTDSGQNWRMLDKRALSAGNLCPLAFDPNNRQRIYAASSSRLKMSEDRGEHWRAVTEQAPWKEEGLTAIGIEPSATPVLLASTKAGTWRSEDAGKSWAKAEGAPGSAIGFLFDTRAARQRPVIFAGAQAGVYRSDDGGKTWVEKAAGLPARGLQGFTGATDAKQLALYCTVPSQAKDGKLEGGVYLSLDGGDSWQSAMGDGINRELGKKDEYGLDDVPQYGFLGAARGQPGTAYVTTRGTGYHPPYHWTVFRTDDFGRTWHYCYTGDFREAERNVDDGWTSVDLNWGFGGPANGFRVCENDPQIAMFTNESELYITRDGAKTWQCAYSRRVFGPGQPKAGEAWQSCGLEVTSCWQFTVDPHEPQRVYLCYTDIGFARSEDGGKSWRHSSDGIPWKNSVYQVVCDPDRTGVLYAACSDQHDIPTWTNIERPRGGGGVCVSEDFGATWKPLRQGLPNAPVTSVVLDPKSPRDARTLYAAVFGHGIFKTIDGGASWQDLSAGLGIEANRHAYAVKLDAEGGLFCTITGKRDGLHFAEGSGLYRLKDEGGWVRLSPPLKWVGDFAFDPHDSRTIYLTASTAPQHEEGGLYKTTDGGATWQRLIKDADLPQELLSYIQGFSVSLDPRRPARILYSTHTHGLYVSDDAGQKWREVRGIPFNAVNRVTVDPIDPDTIWAATFGGGVWKGKLTP